MKVAYVTMQFPAPTETFAGGDARALRKAGVDLQVFALRPRHRDHERMVRERGLEEVPVAALTPATALRGVVLAFLRPAWTWALLAWTFRWQGTRPRQALRCLALVPSVLAVTERLVRGRFDVVHLFWGHYPAMVGLLARRALPDAVASMFLGAYDLDEGRYGGWLPGSAPVARRADVVWTHAHANVPRLRALGVDADRLRCVHRGVDLEAFAARSPEDGGDGSIVAVGSLIELKAMDDVVRAFAVVRREVPEARLHVLGDGAERPRLERLAEELQVAEATTFHGHVAPSEVVRRLRAASAFVLLSRHDRLPNVVKEAMAIGVPCVVTATQGMDELVRDGETGYLVPVGEPDVAAQRLIDVVTEPVRHAPMVAAARARIERDFSVAASMAAYLSTWRALRRGTLPSAEASALEGAPALPGGGS